MGIEDDLESIRIERICVRLDPDNPVCPGCGWREEKELLKFSIPELPNDLVCAECSDESNEPAAIDPQGLKHRSENTGNPVHLPAPGSWLAERWSSFGY